AVACSRRVGVTAGPGRPARPGTGYPALGPAGAYVHLVPHLPGYGHHPSACRDTGVEPSPRRARASGTLPAAYRHSDPRLPARASAPRLPGYGHRTLAPPGAGIRTPARRAQASGPLPAGYGHRALGRPAGYRHSDPRLPGTGIRPPGCRDTGVEPSPRRARASEPLPAGHGHPNPACRDTGIDPSAAPPGTGIRTPAPKPSPRSLPRGRAQSRVYVSCSPLLVFTRWRVSPGSSRTWVAAPGAQALRGPHTRPPRAPARTRSVPRVRELFAAAGVHALEGVAGQQPDLGRGARGAGAARPAAGHARRPELQPAGVGGGGQPGLEHAAVGAVARGPLGEEGHDRVADPALLDGQPAGVHPARVVDGRGPAAQVVGRDGAVGRRRGAGPVRAGLLAVGRGGAGVPLG